jgi:hypothetical protein
VLSSTGCHGQREFFSTGLSAKSFSRFIPARSMLPLSSIVDNDGSLRLLNKKTMAYFDYTARVESRALENVLDSIDAETFEISQL